MNDAGWTHRSGGLTSRRHLLAALPAAALAPAVLAPAVLAPTWLAPSPAAALAPSTYLPLDAVDITLLLPYPPSAGSAAASDDIATVVAIQTASTPVRREQAVLDAEISPQRFVGDRLGPAFTAATVPKTFALLKRVTAEASVLTQKAKEHWARPRPFLVDPRVQALIRKPTNAAYPSGHTIFAYHTAIILGVMVPDKREAFFARAADYGQSRIIAGVHFLTDINAGRTAGTVIAAMFLASDTFKPDLAEATAELRGALGSDSSGGKQ